MFGQSSVHSKNSTKCVNCKKKTIICNIINVREMEDCTKSLHNNRLTKSTELEKSLDSLLLAESVIRYKKNTWKLGSCGLIGHLCHAIIFSTQ